MSVVDASAESTPHAAGPVSWISTAPIPAEERLAWWSDMVYQAVMPVSIRCRNAAAFRGHAETVELPRSQVAAFSFSSMTARRSPLQIRRHDTEAYYIVVVRGGALRLEQQRRVACLGRGDMTLFSTSHPLVCDFRGAGGQVELTLLRLSRTALPLTAGRADELLGERLPGLAGSAALLGTFLSDLPSAARSCGSAELAGLDDIAVALATTVLAARLGRLRDLPADTRAAVLRTRISTFIDQHLANPELRPAAIAASQHISLRTLHALFHDEPETVASTIRRRRLEHCREELADPSLAGRTIGEIAARWGFRGSADFSRAFRRAYGIAPSQARRRGEAPGNGTKS
ncbi:helix-turn-helix domain-containing protein (plasmid) [Embleya sp. NBC_00888]|uniref:helix-turn-helix domain-containing protein n=1 Tax=Embleya sp. NBC_00888 TaxID=2975960 RepID=UPI002F919E7D|nr:helix-turn-helix domain-containing protein [Embleya sp. NBC_00888]